MRDEPDTQEYEHYSDWLAAQFRETAAKAWDEGWCAGRGRGVERGGTQGRGDNPYHKRGDDA